MKSIHPNPLTAPDNTTPAPSNILIVQPDICWQDHTTNQHHLEQLLNNTGSHADLIVLPEMWASGFVTSPTPELLRASSQALEWMHHQSRRLDAAIVGSLPWEDTTPGTYVNRLFFVCPDGTTHHYDKRHLFGYGGETQSYHSGCRRTIVSWRGIRYLLQICYDLRFPVWSRNQNDYDAAIYAASWPERRIQAWDTLLRARAIENQCYVIGCNRVGTVGHTHYSGHSTLLSPLGTTLSSLPDSQEGCLPGVIDPHILQDTRMHFPFLTDRDSFFIDTDDTLHTQTNPK